MEWQDEFIKLYTSRSIEESRKAFKLKRHFIPSKLYRYREVSKENVHYRKKEITKGELFLSHPKKMNDPFECWSFLQSDFAKEYIDKRTFADYYRKTGQSKEVASILQAEDWFDQLMAMEIGEKDSLEEIQKAKQTIENNIMLSVESINKEIREKITDMIRFACFSTTATNLPMWHHYTKEHKGICLEYSTSDIVDTYQLDSLFPVQYVEQLPDMAYMLAHRDKKTMSMPVFLTLHKLKDWSYEQEWRMIYDAGYWLRRGQCLPKGFEKEGVVINFIRPSKVILGTDIESEIEKEITACAVDHGIKVIKAKLTEYGLGVY